MLCLDMLKKLGFGCRQLESGRVEVVTPLEHSDGEPIFAYIDNRDKSVISDNGELLFFLVKSGVDLTHRVGHFAKRAAKYGVHMEKSGEFKLNVNDNLSESFGVYLEFVSNFLEHEYLALTAHDDDTAVDDVIAILQRRNKDLIISKYPEVIGYSEQIYRFDILAGTSLIDVIKPSSLSTGAVLRKSTDIIKSNTDFEPLIVIDDRLDLLTAEKEQNIISSVARVITYTNLEHGTSPLTTLQ